MNERYTVCMELKFCGELRGTRQRDMAGGALALRAFEMNLAPETAQHLVRDKQPHAESLLFVFVAFELPEQAEVFDLGACHAAPVVADKQVEFIAHARRADFHGGLGGGKTEGVVDQFLHKQVQLV